MWLRYTGGKPTSCHFALPIGFMVTLLPLAPFQDVVFRLWLKCQIVTLKKTTNRAAMNPILTGAASSSSRSPSPCIALAVLYFRGGTAGPRRRPYNRFLELLENKQIVNDKNFPLRSCRRGRPADADPARRLYLARGGANARRSRFRFGPRSI